MTLEQSGCSVFALFRRSRPTPRAGADPAACGGQCSVTPRKAGRGPTTWRFTRSGDAALEAAGLRGANQEHRSQREAVLRAVRSRFLSRTSARDDRKCCLPLVFQMLTFSLRDFACRPVEVDRCDPCWLIVVTRTRSSQCDRSSTSARRARRPASSLVVLGRRSSSSLPKLFDEEPRVGKRVRKMR